VAVLTVGTLEAIIRLRDEMSPALKKANENFSKLGGEMKSVGMSLLPVTLAIAAVGGASIKMAMEAVESENLFEVAMKGMSAQARAWSKNLGESLGLNEFALRKNAGILFTMTSALGLTEQAAYDLSTKTVMLAQDMASFYNLDPEEAFRKLRSGLSGEAEGLKVLGIIIKEEIIQEVAWRNGLVAVGQELTAQQKVQARYLAIMEQTKDAQGDLARTINSPTNQLRVMRETMNKLATQLGMALLPAFESFLNFLKSMVPYIQAAVTWFEKLDKTTKNWVIGIALAVAAAGPLIWIFGSLLTLIGGLGSAFLTLKAVMVAFGLITVADTGAVTSFAGATMLATAKVAAMTAVNATANAVNAMGASAYATLSAAVLWLGNASGATAAKTAILTVAEQVSAASSTMAAGAKGLLATAIAWVSNSAIVATIKVYALAIAERVAAAASGLMAAAAGPAAAGLSLIGAAAAIAAAGFVGWEIGKWLGDMKMFENGTVSLSDKIGELGTWLVYGEDAAEEYRKTWIENGQEMERAAKKGKEAIDSIPDLKDKLTGADIAFEIGKLDTAVAQLQKSGPLSATALKNIAEEAKRLQAQGGTLTTTLSGLLDQFNKLSVAQVAYVAPTKEAVIAAQKQKNETELIKQAFDQLGITVNSAAEAQRVLGIANANSTEAIQRNKDKLLEQAQAARDAATEINQAALAMQGLMVATESQKLSDTLSRLPNAGSVDQGQLEGLVKQIEMAKKSGQSLPPVADEIVKRFQLLQSYIAEGEAWDKKFNDVDAALQSLGPTVKTIAAEFKLLNESMLSGGTSEKGGLAGLNLTQLQAQGASLDKLVSQANAAKIPMSELPGLGKAYAEVWAEIVKRTGEAPDYVEAVKDNTLVASEAAKDCSSSYSKWGEYLDAAGKMAEYFGGTLGESLTIAGQLSNSLSQIAQIKPNEKVKDIFGKEHSAKTMAMIQAGTQAAGAIGGMLNKGTGNKMVAGQAMQGAASGAQIGMIAGPYGAAAGAIVGGVLGFLKGAKLKKDAKAAGKALGMEVSQELAKQIQQTAKDLKIDIKSAALLNLSSAMDESKKAAGTFAPQVASLMKGIADGSIPAKEGLEQVGQAFTKIADEAMKAGTVGSREMVALIKASRDMKLDSPEIKAFVSEQLSRAAAGFAKFAALFKKSTKEEVDKLGEEADKAFAGLSDEAVKKLAANTGMVFGAVFNALVSEQGIIGAVDQMKDSFETLRTRLLETLGEDAVTKILGPFGAAFDTIGNEKLRPLFEGIDGLSQAMQGLANSGFLSLEQFGAIQQATKTLFDEAVAGGADMKTALLAVSPSIQAAISAAQEFGVPLDADTQKLKDLAEQNGITFKTDPMRAMLDVMVEIAKVMGATIPDSVKKMQGSFQDAAGAANALGNAVGAVPSGTNAPNQSSAPLHDQFSDVDSAVKSAATEARIASKAAGDSWNESWSDTLKAIGSTTEQWKQENTAIFKASGIESATAVQTAFDAAVKAAKASGDSNKQAAREGRDAAVTAAQDWANANQAAAAQVVASYSSAKAAGDAAAEASLAASKASGDNKLKAMFDAMEAAKLAEITWEQSQASLANAATTTAASIAGTFDAAALGIESTAILATDAVALLGADAETAVSDATAGVIDAEAIAADLAIVSEEIGKFVGDTETAAAAAAGIALLETQTAAVAIGTTTMDQIAAMATSAAEGNAAAGDSLAAALGVGAEAVGELANDPGWADLVLALGSDVPEAAAAAAAAIAAIIANVPGAVNIPVNVVTNGAPPPDVPPETANSFAAGTLGWQNFGRGTPAMLHNTEAVIRPGDPVLPGQVGGGNTTTVHLNINENPMQTSAMVEQMRRFTLRAAERELSKNLSSLIESGRA